MPNDHPMIDLTAPSGHATVPDAKAAKVVMEALILDAIQAYERSTGCRVACLYVDDRANDRGERRTHTVRATVQL